MTIVRPSPNAILRMCINFAHFATRHKIDPPALAELIQLADTAYRAGVRECNDGKSANKQRRMLEAAATELGITVEWSGLYPHFKRDGVEMSLPSGA